MNIPGSTLFARFANSNPWGWGMSLLNASGDINWHKHGIFATAANINVTALTTVAFPINGTNRYWMKDGYFAPTSNNYAYAGEDAVLTGTNRYWKTVFSYIFQTMGTGSSPQIKAKDEATNDANAAPTLFIEAGKKTHASSTGDGGDVLIRPGTTVGGDDGMVDLGKASMTTGDDGGFPCIPGIDGAPTGTPVPNSGFYPICYDYTNNDIYVYDGSWLSVGVT
jgi:hypothetical protein